MQGLQKCERPELNSELLLIDNDRVIDYLPRYHVTPGTYAA